MSDQMNTNNPGMFSVLKKGFWEAWPICLGYIPIGIAFGVLAQKAGLTPMEIGLMSLIVYAGSSQFIAVSMISAGASMGAIIMTTFAVNLRHLLMSSSLSVFLKEVSRLKLTLFAYGVTDESFAVNYVRFKEGGWDPDSALVVNHLPNLTWIAATIMGGYGGQFIPAGAFGIDYALIAMFICLLVFQLKAWKYVLTAILSGTLAVILSLTLPGNWYIVLASVIAATIVVMIVKKSGEENADDTD
jgi:4-azaleucine resistance transporter AzlC